MRKVVCYIATSADGFIAREDGGIDWLHQVGGEPADYGADTFMASIDTIVWGRKTWDQVQTFPDGDAFLGGSDVRNYVFTSDPSAAPPRDGVEFTNEDVKPFMERLRAEAGKDIWMMGGGGIIGAFLDAGELDEFIIHVMPIFLGTGIPLIAPRHLDVRLRLLESKSYDNGVVMLHWGVRR